jgi:hypothetical protein
MVEPRIRKLIGAQQERMLAAPTEARAKFDHPGDIGSAGLGSAFRGFLEGNLPRRLSVAQGEPALVPTS